MNGYVSKCLGQKLHGSTLSSLLRKDVARIEIDANRSQMR